MKPADVRFGNYIADWDYDFFCGDVFKGSSFEVIEVDSDVIARLEEDSIYDFLEGIPLTTEWLIDLGFDYDEITYTNYPISVGKTNNDEFVFWQRTQPEFEFKIEWVHQLQNLYFGITGKELKKKAS